MSENNIEEHSTTEDEFKGKASVRGPAITEAGTSRPTPDLNKQLTRHDDVPALGEDNKSNEIDNLDNDLEIGSNSSSAQSIDSQSPHEPSTPAFGSLLLSCKSSLESLPNLLVQIRAIPNAKRTSSVQTGIEYLLQSTFSAKVLHLGEFSPAGRLGDDFKTVVETFTLCAQHLEACKASIVAAESAETWTQHLANGLDISWKNFCVQLMMVPDLLYLPALNLSSLFGRTGTYQNEDLAHRVDTASYSSIDTHLSRSRRKRRLRVDPAPRAPQLRGGRGSRSRDSAPEPEPEKGGAYYGDIDDRSEMVRSRRRPFSKRDDDPPPYGGRGPPPYPDHIARGLQRSGIGALRDLQEAGLPPVSVFTGPINGPIYITSHQLPLDRPRHRGEREWSRDRRAGREPQQESEAQTWDSNSVAPRPAGESNDERLKWLRIIGIVLLTWVLLVIGVVASIVAVRFLGKFLNKYFDI